MTPDFEDCQICASNSLDEYIIRDMLMQGAKVDSFGVGERLITVFFGTGIWRRV